MLHLVLMGFGLLFGAAMGGENWLWGLAVGFLFGEFVRVRQRLGRLERELASRQPLPASPPPVTESAEEPPAAEPGPVQPAMAPAAQAPAVAPVRPSPAASPAASLLQSAREAEPRPTAAAEEASEQAAEWPPTPAREPIILRGVRALWGFFTGGNPLVRVGSLVLLVGVAFLLKYVSERVSVSIEMRLAGVAAGGIGLLLLGIAQKTRRPGFAMPVQGAGLGVLFLTIFASFRLYPLLSSSLAFSLMLAVVALTVVLALWQDAMILALFGVLGGFLAPLLASTGQGNYVELFSYYLILNVTVAGIAWFRAWRLLNWVGFVCTFGIGLLWGAKYYRPEFFAGTEPFLLAHVGLYILVAVLFASRQPPRLKGLVDATIVFGTPLIGFGLQAGLLADSEHGLAWSALGLGAAYLALAAGLWWRDRRHFRLLFECFLALGVGFVTLAVPLAFDARVTSAMWCVEGAAVAWVGLRQARILPRLSGYALMFLGSLAYLLEDGRSAGTLLFANADFLGTALVAGAFVFVAQMLRRGHFSPLLERALWAYGLLWWVGGGLYEIHWQLAGAARLLTAQGLLAVSVLATYLYGARLGDRARVLSAWAVALAMLVVYGGWNVSQAPLLLNANMGAVALAFMTLALLGWRLVARGFGLSRTWGNVLGALAWAAWLGAGMLEFSGHMREGAWQHWALAWTSVSLTGAYLAARPLEWPEWRLASALQTLIPGVFLVALAEAGLGVLAQWQWSAWVGAFAVQYLLLYWEEGSADSPAFIRLGTRHALTAVTVISVLAYGLWHWAQGVWGADGALTWSLAALAPTLFAGLLAWSRSSGLWPIRSFPRSYRSYALIPVWTWLVLWLQMVNLAPPPVFNFIGYRPLLNVLDLACLAALILLAAHWRRGSRDLQPGTAALGHAVVGLLGFLWLNAALLRALHFIFEIPYRLAPMWSSFTVQASLTLLWVLTALGLMISGARLAQRWVWISGASLMGLAVLKLFLVDTAGSGTLARIVAFFGVAAGLFLAGYLVPRPPGSAVPVGDESDPNESVP